MSTPHATRLDALAVLAVVAIAALVRIAFVAHTPPSPPLSDMAEYWERGVYLYQNAALFPDSWRMPGLPALLALAFLATDGPSLDAARLLNVVAGSLATALTYWLARRDSTLVGATLAATIVAIYPTLVLYTGLVATEAVVAVPVLGALIAASYRTRRAAIALGLLIGGALLVRPASVALLPAALVALAMPSSDERRATRGLRFGLFFAALCLSLLPWWMHNYHLHRRFVPLDTTGGLNLLIGSNALATGRWDWSLVALLQREHLTGVDVTTPAGSDVAARVAVGHASTNVVQWAGLIPSKLSGLFALEGREHAFLYSIGYFGQQTSGIVTAWAAAVVASFPLLTLGTLAGLASAGSVGRAAGLPSVVFLVSAVGLHLLSFGDPRFHLPLVPPMAVLCAGVARIPRDVPRWRGLCLAALFVAMLAPWSAQLGNYWRFIPTLTAPDGWQSNLPFDDLL